MNSQRGQVSTIAIVLLVVGLVVGAGGCYFAVSSTFEQKARDYEDTILAMEQDITTYESQVTDLEGEITDYESQVMALERDITGCALSSQVLESLVSDMQSELDELEQIIKDHKATIVEKENDISDLQESMADYEEQLSTLESEIQVLESMLIPSTGYEKFSAYGFSFEYPKLWYMEIEGLLDLHANTHSGMVRVTRMDERESFNAFWTDAAYPANLDFLLEGAFEGLQAIATTYAMGEKITSTIHGHEIRYQNGTAIIEGETGYFVYAYWNCDINQVTYGLGYGTEEEDAIASFLQYLEYFICHSSYSST